MVFSHFSAVVRCEISSDAAVVTYSGPITNASYSALLPLATRATQGAAALMIRLDGCLTTLSDAMPDSVVTPEGCLVVRPDQFDFWSDYAKKSARSGVMRVVFLDSQLSLAHCWLARRALPRALPAL